MSDKEMELLKQGGCPACGGTYMVVRKEGEKQDRVLHSKNPCPAFENLDAFAYLAGVELAKKLGGKVEAPVEELALDKMELYPDGQPILVARPNDPVAAVEIGKQVVKGFMTWADGEKELNDKCGPYTFVGYMGKKRVLPGSLGKHKTRKDPKHLVDHTGKVVGEYQSGDSLVRADFFQGAQQPN